MRKGKGQLTHKQSWDMMKMENRSLRRLAAEQTKLINKLQNDLYSLTIAHNKLLKEVRGDA